MLYGVGVQVPPGAPKRVYMNKKDIICQLPFYAMDITPDQRVAPCCLFGESKAYTDLDNANPFLSSFFESTRESIRQGIPVKNCETCYKNERVGEFSLRKLALEMYSRVTNTEFDPDTSDTKLRGLNISFSNLCNNKCRMCSAEFSTSWYNDSKALGWKIPKGQISYRDIIDSVNFDDIITLNFVGGEPMMMQEQIIELLTTKCKLEQLTVVITTNVTKLPSKELVDILNKCNRVEWDLSIDAYGSLNDFLRKGSVWEETLANIKWYRENFKHLKAQTAISIYNVNCFAELTKFLQSMNIIQNSRIVFDNEYMLPRHLPDNAKNFVINYVKKVKKELDIPICDAIISEVSKEGDLKKFEEVDSKLNTIRNEHWKTFNQELFDIIYK